MQSDLVNPMLATAGNRVSCSCGYATGILPGWKGVRLTEGWFTSRHAKFEISVRHPSQLQELRT